MLNKYNIIYLKKHMFADYITKFDEKSTFFFKHFKDNQNMSGTLKLVLSILPLISKTKRVVEILLASYYISQTSSKTSRKPQTSIFRNKEDNKQKCRKRDNLYNVRLCLLVLSTDFRSNMCINSLWMCFGLNMSNFKILIFYVNLGKLS